MLYSTSAPTATPAMLENLCDELGLTGDGPSHPALLGHMLDDLGVEAARREALEADAERDLRHLLSQPLMFPTLRETALGMLLEVSSFEWALSRVAGRMAIAIEQHWGLSPSTLRWFTLHATVDVRHAREAVDAVAEFVDFYDVDHTDLQTIIELTFRQNVLVRRYFPTGGRLEIGEAAAS
jgi:pyrroloquinoline quinone (PQQ) biosynthesis protein C